MENPPEDTSITGYTIRPPREREGLLLSPGMNIREIFRLWKPGLPLVQGIKTAYLIWSVKLQIPCDPFARDTLFFYPPGLCRRGNVPGNPGRLYAAWRGRAGTDWVDPGPEREEAIVNCWYRTNR